MEKQIEVWKEIKGYENMYMISNLGRIKSLNRDIYIDNNFFRKAYEKILSNTLDSHGYYVVHLYKNSICKKQYIHILLATYFLGYEKNKNYIIDHIDGNPANNSLNNLQVITQSENIRKAKKRNHTTSIYKGVCFDKSRNKWLSSCFVNKKHLYLGRYKTEIEAKKIYELATININLYNNNRKDFINKLKQLK